MSRLAVATFQKAIVPGRYNGERFAILWGGWGWGSGWKNRQEAEEKNEHQGTLATGASREASGNLG